MDKKTHVVHKKMWTSIDSGLGSGAVCVQGALRPISSEVGPKPLCTPKGPSVAYQLRRLEQAHFSEQSLRRPVCQCSEGSRSLRRKLRHFARSVTKALAAQCGVWSSMEKELLGMQSERKSTHDEIREAKMLHTVDEKAFLQVEQEYGGVGHVKKPR